MVKISKHATNDYGWFDTFYCLTCNTSGIHRYLVILWESHGNCLSTNIISSKDEYEAEYEGCLDPDGDDSDQANVTFKPQHGNGQCMKNVCQSVQNLSHNRQHKTPSVNDSLNLTLPHQDRIIPTP